MPSIQVADKPTLDTIKSTVDSVKTTVSTVNTKVAGLTSGMSLKKGSVVVPSNGTATIPRTANLVDSIAVIGSYYVAYASTNAYANWRSDNTNIISVSDINDSVITLKGGTNGGTLYYTYWE